MYSNFWE